MEVRFEVRQRVREWLYKRIRVWVRVKERVHKRIGVWVRVRRRVSGREQVEKRIPDLKWKRRWTLAKEDTTTHRVRKMKSSSHVYTGLLYCRRGAHHPTKSLGLRLRFARVCPKKTLNVLDTAVCNVSFPG